MEEENLKKNGKKKIIATIVIILVLFLAVNGYAATQGYNNIFFVINNLINPTQITNAEEILTDRDITISYQSIEIAKGLEIQVNRLVVFENEATLQLNINEKENAEVNPYTYIVYDITNGRKELLGNQEANRNEQEGDYRYNEEITLVNFSNDTNSLQLEIHDDKYNKIAVLEIKIAEKEIDVLSSSVDEFEKISEVELKRFISNVARINFFKDKDAITKYHTEEEYKNDVKIMIALELISEKTQEEIIYATREDVHKVLKELTGKDYDEPIESANIGTCYDEKNDAYKYIAPGTEHAVHSTCLDISSIEYTNSIYIANCTYTYITKEAYENNTIEELQQYVATVDFKINENYEYSKFRLLNDPDSAIVENNSQEKEEIADTTPNTSTNVISNTILNTSTNIVSNTIPNWSTNVISNTTTNSSTNVISNTSLNMSNTINNNIIDNLPNTIPDYSYEKVDNYASTMKWETLYTPGLKTRVPAIWNVEEVRQGYSGPEDDGQIATIVSGLARGINRETNEIVDSNMKITYYMPDFLDSEKSLDEYANILCNDLGAVNTGCGYSKDGMGVEWLLLNGSENCEYYCHIEHSNGAYGIDTIGYLIKIETDNRDNYKYINILNWIFGDIKTTSF